MIRVRKSIKNLIEKNEGSTLITVIVAISFVIVLTSIILGTSLINMKMKGIDRHAKDDFYYAERALNDIYTGIGQEVAVIAGEKYDESFAKVGTTFEFAEEAETDFKTNFSKEVYKHFLNSTSPLDAPTSDELEALRVKLDNYISTKGSTSRTEQVDSVENFLVEKKNGYGTRSSFADSPYCIRVSGVQISSTDSTGYQSTISTDIVIYIPTADFLGTNVDVTDYGLIANKGIYFGSGSSPSPAAASVDITGNVYAGIHQKDDSDVDTDNDSNMYLTTAEYNSSNLYGGINIRNRKVTMNGNYIVSKGDINIAGNNSELIIGKSGVSDANLPNVWFNSLRTLKGSTGTPKVTLHSNTFALNDLELNANNSTVDISGNYYGYNDKTLPDSSRIPDSLLLGYSSKRDDAESSAIIINGSECSLSMKDINTFVLMGKAYVDFTTNGNSVGVLDPDDHEISVDPVVPTAEGVALKTNQQLYLVPVDFLNCANPIDSTEFTGKFEISPEKKDLIKWFGYKYVVPSGVDYTDEDTTSDTDDKAYKKFYSVYKVTREDGTQVYYAYLNFNDKKWIPVYDATGKLKEFEEAPAGDPVGTGGYGANKGASVSSMTAFFNDIMSATSTNEGSQTQPSAYRLKERIERSMTYSSYFSLKDCIIGDKNNLANTVLYSRNAVVSYDVSDDGSSVQSNLLGNNVGMIRFADYPQKMFHRYQFLCTSLDGKEEMTLDGADPGSPSDEWKVDSDTPMSHFVKLSAMSGKDTFSQSHLSTCDIRNITYGDCIVKDGDFTIDSSTCTVGNTFKGIAIVDGNITVKSDYNVYGLLMATGTITIEGNSVITCDKGLIQSRIEKEMQLVKQSTDGSAAYKDYYLISYLVDKNNPTQLLYDVDPGSAVKEERIEADYNEYVQFENWKKGPR